MCAAGCMKNSGLLEDDIKNSCSTEFREFKISTLSSTGDSIKLFNSIKGINIIFLLY